VAQTAEGKERFAILGKEEKGDWEVISLPVTLELGWRSAHLYLTSEHKAGNKGFKCVVTRLSDWDSGTVKPLSPPRGFDFELPLIKAEKQASPVVTAEAVKPLVYKSMPTNRVVFSELDID
jgi:hypothetical protein